MHVCWLEHSMMLEKPIPSTGIPPAVIQKKKKKKWKAHFRNSEALILRALIVSSHLGGFAFLLSSSEK